MFNSVNCLFVLLDKSPLYSSQQHYKFKIFEFIKGKGNKFVKVASKHTLTHRHLSVMYGLFHIIQSNNLNLYANKVCNTYFTKNNFFLFIKSSSNSWYSWGIYT